jgi:SAM-dependent methyltransferase
MAPNGSTSFAGAAATPIAPVACVAVIVHCRNNGGVIVELLDQLLSSPLTAEVIVVDDKSEDDTYRMACTVTDPRVRVVRHGRRLGRGASFRYGLQLATAPVVAIHDANLDLAPDDLETLLGPIIDGRADVVYGSRFYSSHGRRVLSFWHYLASKVLTTVSNMTTNLNLSDMTTRHKAFRLGTVRSLPIEEDGFGFEAEITAKVAAARVRVFEVGIRYRGQTGGPVAMRWADGLRALYSTLKHAPLRSRRARPVPVRDVACFASADTDLADTLDVLEQASAYSDWILDLINPYVGASICEIGAGHGTFTEGLSRAGTVVACDPSDRCVQRMRARFAGNQRIEVVHGEMVGESRRFDAVVMVNVLEHIADDEAAIVQCRNRLGPGGHVVVFAPALEALYSEFDRSIGHYRRYTRGSLGAVVHRAGLEVVELRYVNSIGAIAWWLVTKKLGRRPTTTAAVRAYDRFIVPLVRRFEHGRSPLFGQSVLCVARLPLDPAAA